MNRYNFSTIFNYNPDEGVITPRYNLIINGAPFSVGSPIYRSTSFGGLNLFNYIGRSIAGSWNREARIMTILGFY